MPNLRPLKDTDDGKINAMKVASVLILGAVLGALIQSNVQASRDAAPAPRRGLSKLFSRGSHARSSVHGSAAAGAPAESSAS